MKNKIFTTVLALTCVFLAIFWTREQHYKSQLKRVDAEVIAIRTKLRMLRLKTQALKAEIEMLSLTAYAEMINGHRNPLISRVQTAVSTKKNSESSALLPVEHSQQQQVKVFRKVPRRHNGKKVTNKDF